MADKIQGMENAYKIKLRIIGLRMVYVVDNDTNTITVYVVANAGFASFL